jgi:hypothetical protein
MAVHRIERGLRELGKPGVIGELGKLEPGKLEPREPGVKGKI